MFLFTFNAMPTSSNRCNCLGAIINCWVNFKDFEGARFIAHKFLESQGWLIKAEEEDPIIVFYKLLPIRKISKIKNRCYNIANETGLSYLCITYNEE